MVCILGNGIAVCHITHRRLHRHALQIAESGSQSDEHLLQFQCRLPKRRHCTETPCNVKVC